MLQKLTVLVHVLSCVSCIWPVPYEVHLDEEETFLVSDVGDELYDKDDEMLKPEEFERLLDKETNAKFFRIHQIAMRHNQMNDEREAKAAKGLKVANYGARKYPEQNFDLEEPMAWQGGFVDKFGNFVNPDNEGVYYLNELAKELIDAKIDEKRAEEGRKDNEDEAYDYNGFKREYEAEIAKEEREKNALRLKEAKEDETVEDAVDAVVNLNRTNCTVEEKQGIGLAAIKCMVDEVQRSHSPNALVALLERIGKITAIWLCIYIIIAVPLWCTRGWCCCCCRCKWCHPRTIIDEAKRFYMLNPVGTYHNEEDKPVTYRPTNYEKYAQKRLEKALFDL